MAFACEPPGPKRFLVITIDVECDSDGGPTWRYSAPLTFYGVLDAIPNRLQPLFNKYGAKPTYLVSNVVLENDACVEALASPEGDYELGTHLHGDFIEPQKRVANYAGAKTKENQFQYSQEVELAKMQNLTRLFEERFKRHPLSFRAGRYSAGNNTIKILSKLGYKVDTSVTPHIRWVDDTRKGPDFRSAPEQPYFPVWGSITTPGTSDILEVPISIKKGILTRWHRWLRPSYSSAAAMMDVIQTYSRKYSGQQCIVYNMMFHNTELFPGVSPHTKTEEECQRYLREVERVLEYCVTDGIGFSTLSELYDFFEQVRGELSNSDG